MSGPGGWRTLRAGAAALAVVGVLGAVPPAVASASSQALGWTQHPPAGRPPARIGAAAAYDPATSDVVLFGGKTASSTRLAVADTWTWNGSAWTRQHPAASPPARFGAAMAYDAATGDVVLFGGNHGVRTLDDTWTWNGSTWTRQHPAASPPARYDAAMAYDAATGDVVLFGGRSDSAGGGAHGGTWTWDGSTWTEQAPATHPPALYGAAATSDAATGNVVLFGGASLGSLSGETWTWDGSTWTAQHPAASPDARESAAMTYDAATGNVVLFGGADTNGAVGDTWTWDGTTWTAQHPAASPHARYFASMAYDGTAGNVVLFGGDNGVRLLGDTWTWG